MAKTETATGKDLSWRKNRLLQCLEKTASVLHPALSHGTHDSDLSFGCALELRSHDPPLREYPTETAAMMSVLLTAPTSTKDAPNTAKTHNSPHVCMHVSAGVYPQKGDTACAFMRV